MAEHHCTFPDCSLPAPTFRARLESVNASMDALASELSDAQIEIARLRGVNAELVGALTELVEPEKFDAHPQDYMPVWHKARAALRSATETPGGGSDVSPVSDGSNRDSKPSATETKGEPLCPRPANSAPPGPVTVRECVARSECGCDEMKGYPT